MKNNALILIAATAMCLANAFAGPTLTYGTGSFVEGSGEVRYIDGQLVPQGTNWLVELVVDIGNANYLQGEVIHSTTAGFLFGDGWLYESINTPNDWDGLTIGTIIYDSNTADSADYMAKFTGTKEFSWGVPPPTADTYDAGEVLSTIGTADGQWQAIPEPTVAAFIGVFGSGMLIARRLFSKSQASA